MFKLKRLINAHRDSALNKLNNIDLDSVLHLSLIITMGIVEILGHVG